MNNKSSVKPLASVLKVISLLLMLYSIALFVMGFFFIVTGRIAGSVEVSSSDVFVDAVMQIFFGEKYGEAYNDFISTFYANVIGDFIAIFVYSLLHKYFKMAVCNDDWYFDGAKRSLAKVLACSVLWFTVPFAVSKYVISILPHDLFEGLKANINITAIAVTILTAIVMIKSKKQITEINSETEE